MEPSKQWIGLQVKMRIAVFNDRTISIMVEEHFFTDTFFDSERYYNDVSFKDT